MAKQAACPQCQSEEIIKERILGMPTGDYICKHCRYESTANQFKDEYKKIHNK